MASKRAKQKQTLEKAKQLVLKNKKGKAKAKPKQSYPEGQNAPQSKAYTIENDKTQSAKRTGWRFTKEGAKRLKKDINATPSQADVDKYRNQTFKVKGNVNKSGPKGTSDGSHRYIYIERRADKSDLKRTQKLAKGGKVREFEINDEETGKTLIFKARSLEEAEGISSTIDFNDYEDGDIVDVLEEMDSYNEMDEYAKGGALEVGDLVNVPSINKSGVVTNVISNGKHYTVKFVDGSKIVYDKNELKKIDDEYAKGGETYSLDYFKNKVDELDPDGNCQVQYDEDVNDWYWVDNFYNTWKGNFKTEYDAYDSLLEHLDKSYAKGGQTKNINKFKVGDKVIYNHSGKFGWEDIDEAKHGGYDVDVHEVTEVDYSKGSEGIKLDGDDQWVHPNHFKLEDNNAKGGETKNLPTEKDVREFQEYVFSFYGKDGLYGQDFFEGGATTEEILLATNQYLTFCAKNPDLWGDGDSGDREIVRDLMLYHRGEKIDTIEHGEYIKRMKKTTILEYGGILQPMIGGVNADPRFDIYNTTMFAEDGAMLELGGENPDEKLRFEVWVDVHEDEYEFGEGKLVNAYKVDWLKQDIVKANDLLEFLYDKLDLSRYAQDYIIDDDGIIHTSRLENADGNEASESQIERWKKGEIMLYSAQYSIYVEAVGQTRIPTISELHEVTDIPTYEDGGDTDEYARGGKIKDQYKQFPKGSFKREKGVWNAWTPAQKLHFLNDHADELTQGGWGISKSDFNKISKVDYDGLSDLDDDEDMQGGEIFVSVNDALSKHIQEGQYADGGKIVKRRYLQGRGKNVFTFGYGMPKDAIDMFGTKGGTEYFIMPNGKVYKKSKYNMNLFEFIGTQKDRD